MSFKLKEPQVLYNAKGKKTHVLLPYENYERMLEQLEDLEDHTAMDEVAHEETISWEKAKKIIEKKRKK